MAKKKRSFMDAARSTPFGKDVAKGVDMAKGGIDAVAPAYRAAGKALEYLPTPALAPIWAGKASRAARDGVVNAAPMVANYFTPEAMPDEQSTQPASTGQGVNLNRGMAQATREYGNPSYGITRVPLADNTFKQAAPMAPVAPANGGYAPDISATPSRTNPLTIKEVNRLRAEADANGTLAVPVTGSHTNRDLAMQSGTVTNTDGTRGSFSAFGSFRKPQVNPQSIARGKSRLMGDSATTSAQPTGIPPTTAAPNTPKIEASPNAGEIAAKVLQQMYQDSLYTGVKPKEQRTTSTAQRVLGATSQPLSAYNKAQQRIGVPMTGFGASQPARSITTPIGGGASRPSKPMARPSSMPLMGRGLTPTPNRFDDSMA